MDAFLKVLIVFPGKTVLVANSINRMRQVEAQLLFVFLSFDDKEQDYAVKVLHSLMCQMTNRSPHMWPILHERYITDAGKLKSNWSYLEDLFIELVRDAGLTFIIVDGVDEVDQSQRAFLLKSLMRVKESCKNVKLLISSRLEADIARALEKKAVVIRVDHRNAEDIETYVHHEVDEWLPRLIGYGASETTSSQIKTALKCINEKANGNVAGCLVSDICADFFKTRNVSLRQTCHAYCENSRQSRGYSNRDGEYSEWP